MPGTGNKALRKAQKGHVGSNELYPCGGIFDIQNALLLGGINLGGQVSIDGTDLLEDVTVEDGFAEAIAKICQCRH